MGSIGGDIWKTAINILKIRTANIFPAIRGCRGRSLTVCFAIAL